MWWHLPGGAESHGGGSDGSSHWRINRSPLRGPNLLSGKTRQGHLAQMLKKALDGLCAPVDVLSR